MHSKQLDKVFVSMQSETSIQPIEAYIEKDRLKINSLSIGSMYLSKLIENCKYYGCGFFIQSVIHDEFFKVQIVIYDFKSENFNIQKNEK